MKSLDPPIEIETEITQSWKTQNFKGWKDKNEKEKEKLIKSLLLTINKEKKGTKLKIIFTKTRPSSYDTTKNIIYLSNCSIISSLHELSHHLNGPSELVACVYSIFLFKKVFPHSWNTLKFKGHLLVKK